MHTESRDPDGYLNFEIFFPVYPLKQLSYHCPHYYSLYIPNYSPQQINFEYIFQITILLQPKHFI